MVEKTEVITCDACGAKSEGPVKEAQYSAHVMLARLSMKWTPESGFDANMRFRVCHFDLCDKCARKAIEHLGLTVGIHD